MKKIFSRVEPERLLHLVLSTSNNQGRAQLVDSDQFLQIATLELKNGESFSAHRHLWKDLPTNKSIAQESWVIIQGSVTIHMYDIDGTHLGDETIYKGDCSMTFEGGHTYTILEDDTVVYEYKTGPYTGIENDKVFINDHR